MPSGSYRGRPIPVPIKKLCTKCGKRSGAPAVNKGLCKSCLASSPTVRNSAAPRHPRQS